MKARYTLAIATASWTDKLAFTQYVYTTGTRVSTASVFTQRTPAFTQLVSHTLIDPNGNAASVRAAF